MQRIFSTRGVRPGEAFDYWTDIVCANLQRVKSEPFDRQNFYGELDMGALADIVLAAWRATPGITHCEGTDDLVLVLPSSRAVIEFADRRFEANRCGVYLIDARKPYIARSLEPPERIQVRLPRDALEQRVSITNAVNRPIPLQGDTVLLAAFVRDLVSIGPSTLSPEAAALVSEQLLDLVAVALRSVDTVAKPPKTRVRPSRGSAVRFRALHAKGLSEQEIARRMRMHPAVARAQRRRFGLPPNEGDDRDGALEIGRLALQLSLLSDVRGRQDLVEQLRHILLLPPREPLNPEDNPHDEGISDDD